MVSDGKDALKDIYHACVGTLYFIVGITSIIVNSRLIKIFTRDKPMKSPRGILHVNLAITNIGLVSGFLLTGTANFKQRWPFSDFVCDAYSLVGMVTGVAEILTVMAIGFEAYFAVCWPKLCKSLTPWHYYVVVLPAIWLTSLFWGVLPFYGWGSYSLDPAGTTCLISWQTVDEYYTFYILNFTAWCYAFPLLVLKYLQSTVFAKLEQEAGQLDITSNWFSEKQLCKLGHWFGNLTFIQWLLFGAVCMAVFFVEPTEIPKWFCTMVPLQAKILSMFYPLSYVIISPKFRDAMAGVVEEREVPKSPAPEKKTK